MHFQFEVQANSTDGRYATARAAHVTIPLFRRWNYMTPTRAKLLLQEALRTLGSHVKTDCGFHFSVGEVLSVHVVCKRLKLTHSSVPMAKARLTVSTFTNHLHKGWLREVQPSDPVYHILPGPAHGYDANIYPSMAPNPRCRPVSHNYSYSKVCAEKVVQECGELLLLACRNFCVFIFG